MPTSNTYTPPTYPWSGPPVSNTVPVTPGVATSTNPPPPPPKVPAKANLKVTANLLAVANVTSSITSNFSVQDEGKTISVNPVTLNFVGSGVTVTGLNGIVTIKIPENFQIAQGPQYAIQYAGPNNYFYSTANFALDTVNKMLKVGTSVQAAPYDINLSGNLLIGYTSSLTGATPFGGGYFEVGRIRVLDDANVVYGFSGLDGPGFPAENWMCMVNEPGHEYTSGTALVLGQGGANSNTALFGVSVNDNAIDSFNPLPPYANAFKSGWKQLLSLTGKDLFLPKLSEAVGNKFLAYNPVNGRVSYTNGIGGSSIAVQDEGTNVVASTSIINFVGSLVTASNVGNVATVTVNGLTVKDEGANVLVGANTFNFIGGGVTASNAGGGVVNVNIPTSNGITVLDENIVRSQNATSINFVGAGVISSNVGGVATVTIPGGLNSVIVKDEGLDVVAANTFNFVGAGVTASNVGGVATVTILGGAGITVQDESTNVVSTASIVNFVGAGVLASNVGGVATVSIPGGLNSVIVKDEGANVVAANTFNFVGSGVTASNVGGVATITINGGNSNANPAGNTSEVQFNNNGAFGANYNLRYNNGGLFVGGIGNPDANAQGIISAINEFRVGIWTYDGSLYGDKWGRIRMGEDNHFKNVEFYGFIGDPSINPRVGVAPRTLVLTNEELEVKQAMVLMDGFVYDNTDANSEGTIFGVSGINSVANPTQPTTGLEPGWAKLIDVTNKGNVKIGGSLVISPSFQPTPPANNQVGIKFADGTFQYTAAGTSGIIVKDEGTNVVASANTLNFVGVGVTASNVGGVATITIPGGGSGITVQEEGSNVVNTASTVNFVGSLVTASNVANVATITVNGPAIQDEGSNVITSANIINFVGSGVTASNVGNVATITIASGGSGITVQEEGSNVVTSATTLNFIGSSVTASNVGGVATVTVTSSSGDTVYDKGNVSGATTINISDGTIQLCTLTGNTVFNISSATVGKSLTLILTQGTGGNKFISFGNTVYWAVGYKTLSTAAGAIDMVNLVNLGGVFAATLTTGYAT